MDEQSVPAARLLKMGEEQLHAHGVSAPRWEAETILLHVLGWTRARLYQYLPNAVAPEECRQFFALVAKRSQRIPLQYLLGSQDFMGLSFQVDERVLIPRPETELLVERVLFLLQGRPNPCVADVGTGSGAIAVSLAVFHPAVEILAVDVSPDALHVAQANAAKHHVTERIRFLQGDMLEPLRDAVGLATLDGIVSNPPYIADHDLAELQPEVRDYEPRLALAGGADGLFFYRQLVQNAGAYLKEDGFIALEIGYDQGLAVTDMIHNTGEYAHIDLQQDYAGRDRIVWAVARKQKQRTGGPA